MKVNFVQVLEICIPKIIAENYEYRSFLCEWYVVDELQYIFTFFFCTLFKLSQHHKIDYERISCADRLMPNLITDDK